MRDSDKRTLSSVSEAKKKQAHGQWKILFAWCLVLLCSLGILYGSRQTVKARGYDEMLAAAQKTEQLYLVLKEKREQLGIPINTEDDINRTGLIGEPYSEITTTLGALEAKRSSVNPNAAALVVSYFIKLGLKPGDTVAVNLSSSFPALNLAVLAALDTCGLKGIVINSIGASTYGANRPDFTYLDMEHLLTEEGLLENHTTWFSPGGAGDSGREFPQEVLTEIETRLTAYGFRELPKTAGLQEDVRQRISLYEAGAPVSCLINVGGNLAAFGENSSLSAASGGLLTSAPPTEQGTGLIPHYLKAGVPVIHLLNLKALFSENGLPIDPVPVPEAGEGGLYSSRRTAPVLLGIVAAVNILWLVFVIRRYFPKRRQGSMPGKNGPAPAS